MLCFIFLSHLEPAFFLFHLYQSLIYLVIILMLFYFEDQYAYMLGMIAPAATLVILIAIGLFWAGLRQAWWIVSPPYAGHQVNQVSLMAAVTSLMAVLMILFCAYRWRREYAGLGKGLSTFLVSLAIVLVYDGLLIFWFWRVISAR